VLQHLTIVGKKIHSYINAHTFYLQVTNMFIGKYLTLDEARNEENRLSLRAGTQTFEE